MNKWAWLPFKYKWKTASSWLAFQIMNKSPSSLNWTKNVSDISFNLMSFETRSHVLVWELTWDCFHPHFHMHLCVWKTKRANWVVFPWLFDLIAAINKLYTDTRAHTLTHMHTHMQLVSLATAKRHLKSNFGNCFSFPHILHLFFIPDDLYVIVPCISD